MHICRNGVGWNIGWDSSSGTWTYWYKVRINTDSLNYYLWG